MTKWEYLQVSDYQYKYKLNELGRERWELVNLAVGFESGPFGGSRKYTYVFKRPLVE